MGTQNYTEISIALGMFEMQIFWVYKDGKSVSFKKYAGLKNVTKLFSYLNSLDKPICLLKHYDVF